ncbi:MAG: sigma-70 family RNA polymerase sigma factor [Acidobacteriota bacterium]|jgi:RNA polymerase sigma-70 factor (ECF subfamily)
MTPTAISDSGSAAASPCARIDGAIRAFQAGEDREASFRILVKRFYRPVEGFFARRVPSPEDRRDLTQETFLRLYEGLDGFRGESRFSTWLFQIAYNTYVAWLRRRQRRQESSFEGPGTADDRRALQVAGGDSAFGERPESAVGALLDRERRLLLRRAMDELPERMRHCMLLRIVHELSYKEVAAAMGLSMGTVKAHLFQGRERLRRTLDGVFGEIEV